MNELEQIKSQLDYINNQRVRLETLIEQAKKQCLEIESKYNISSEQELKALVDKADLEYQTELQKAQEYIQETNQLLSTYQGIL